MKTEEFKQRIKKANTMVMKGEKPHYWAGYTRATRRLYYGNKSEALETHFSWLTGSGGDETLSQRAEGYRDGYGCKQNSGDCVTCGLASEFHDCNNMPITNITPN